MKADRELLELAAKAAGLELDWDPERTCSNHIEGTSREWNPLRDDGDALRLAVKLELRVENFGDVVQVVPSIGGGQPVELCTGPSGVDPYAATRRAVVVAAAEIGGAAMTAPLTTDRKVMEQALEALGGIELVERGQGDAKEVWLLLRHEPNKVGTGSIRLDGGFANAMSANFVFVNAAIAALRTRLLRHPEGKE